MRKERRLLIDGRHAERAGERRREVTDGLAPNLERPRIGPLGAAQDFDQRRFAGAVFADDRVYLAGEEIERHPAKRARAGERLRDGRCLEEGHFSKSEV